MEVRGLPERRAGEKPAVRLAGKVRWHAESGVGEVRHSRLPVSEDSDHGGERGMAGSMGGVEAQRAGSAG